MNLFAGQLLASRFRVKEKVGSGAMGTVYSATDQVLDRMVAIKVLRSELASDKKFVERFSREAKIVSQLSLNPHVVTIYDIGRTTDGVPYLVTEFLTGHPLSDEVCGDLKPSRSWVLEVAVQISLALVDSHERGVVHRDLKPANVFVVRTDVVQLFVKVLDFGLSRSSEYQLSDEHATVAGTIQGTPRYMAPETIAGEGATASSDIYSLGVLLYEFANGLYPYKARGPGEELRAHLAADPAPFPTERLKFPDEFQELVMQMICKSPTERPNSRECLRCLSRISRSFGN
jgi:serine/threonine-protein kinase